MGRKHIGSSIDDFLKEEGIFEEAQMQAVKEVVAWQLAEAMKEKKISKMREITFVYAVTLPIWKSEEKEESQRTRRMGVSLLRADW